ncbi:MAG TPA: thiamine biosynthesis protein ThiF [Lentisphaeria bacterium]|nr:thiamine biosynthesis protein ThiF [Lentisphaeria bacterium]
MMEAAEKKYFSSNPPGATEKLQSKHVFIAGAGGLGSNVAIALARAGIGTMTIVDFDKVEPSNLNRQQYFRDQVGMMKVDALRMNLARINPKLKINTLSVKITPKNCDDIIPADAGIIFECFDRADCKAYLSSFCMTKRKTIPLIVVSGLAGLGDCSIIKVRRGPGNSWIVGDGKTEMNPENGTISSRVVLTAALQAHTGIRILLGLEKSKK